MSEKRVALTPSEIAADIQAAVWEVAGGEPEAAVVQPASPPPRLSRRDGRREQEAAMLAALEAAEAAPKKPAPAVEQSVGRSVDDIIADKLTTGKDAAERRRQAMEEYIASVSPPAAEKAAELEQKTPAAANPEDEIVAQFARAYAALDPDSLRPVFDRISDEAARIEVDSAPPVPQYEDEDVDEEYEASGEDEGTLPEWWPGATQYGIGDDEEDDYETEESDQS